MLLLKNVVLVLYCYFCLSSAKRLECNDIVTTENGYYKVLKKFTVEIPISNITDIISIRVRLSGPRETISHLSLSLKTDPEKRRTITQNKVEIHYVLAYNVSLHDPFITNIEVGTEDQCLSYCEGRPDLRPNTIYSSVSYKFSLFGKSGASSPDCTTYDPVFSPLPEDCGTTVLGRIFGGVKVEREAWPWLAALYIRDMRSTTFKCGANVISSWTVLTSAHCVMNNLGLVYDARKIGVFVGRHNLTDFNEQGYAFHLAEKIIVHSGFKGSHMHNIALIKLAKEFVFTNLIRPICLWSDIEPVTGHIAAIAGWGETDEMKFSSVPLVSEATIIDIDVCKNSNELYQRHDLNGTICAGDLDGTGPCIGDSGGGLVLVDKYRRYAVRGLISVILADAHTGKCDLSNYVLYTDISTYYNWIRYHMW